MTPMSLIYEESHDDFVSMTSLSAGKLSLNEIIYEDPLDDVRPTHNIRVIRFEEGESGDNNPDLKLVYKELKEKRQRKQDNLVLEISLSNPCKMDFDPGFVDRTFMLFNYADLDPDCISTVKPPSIIADQQKINRLQIDFSCPKFELDFRIPKADMRPPKEIPKFAQQFWTRKIHSEMLTLKLFAFNLSVLTFSPVESANLEVRAICDKAEISFREDYDLDATDVINARTMSVFVSVCLDDEKKKQGKFVSRSGPNSSIRSGSFFVSEQGQVSSNFNNSFLEQLKSIEEALISGSRRNNLLIDIRLDDIDVLLPSKRVYEVIYNRLGNDMILWLPEIFKVKEYLYNEKMLDPLADPDAGFSAMFSGTKEALTYQVCS